MTNKQYRYAVVASGIFTLGVHLNSPLGYFLASIAGIVAALGEGKE